MLAWADAHLARTGRWPHAGSGPIPEAPGVTWGAVNMALYGGHRGLPGGDSLSLLLGRLRPPSPVRPCAAWTPEEDALVRTLPAKEAAQRTGRGLWAVYTRRHMLGVPDGRVGTAPRGWTAEEDKAVRGFPAREAAWRTGRSLSAVYARRRELGVGRRY